MCVWVSMCVRGWVAKEGILSSSFLTGIRVSRGIPLSILVQRPDKELCSWKPARPEEKDKGHWSVKSETPVKRVRDSSPRCKAGQSALRKGSIAVEEQEQRHGAVKTMAR